MKYLKYILAFIFILIINLSTAQEAKVNFKIKNFGVYVNGSFNDISVSNNLTIDNVEQGFINAEVKVSSISTGNKKRDAHLLEEEYFNAAKYANITFKSTKIEKVSKGNYTVHGNLTIKGISKKVKMPLRIEKNNDKTVLKILHNINRRDYNVGKSSLVMSNTVIIEVSYVLKG